MLGIVALVFELVIAALILSRGRAVKRDCSLQSSSGIMPLVKRSGPIPYWRLDWPT
jgi:hypothetical protein